jgi:hypothetical protein
MNETEWVKCPICGQPDTERRAQGSDKENLWVYSCANGACRSNGGDYDIALDGEKDKSYILASKLNGSERIIKNLSFSIESINDSALKVADECQYWKEQALKYYERSVWFRSTFPWRIDEGYPDVPVLQEHYDKIKAVPENMINALKISIVGVKKSKQQRKWLLLGMEIALLTISTVAKRQDLILEEDLEEVLKS